MTVLAGCSGDEGGGDSGSDGTDAGTDTETLAETAEPTTATTEPPADETTMAETEAETEVETETEAETTMDESGGGNESGGGGDGSSSLSDSGDTDITLEAADIADSISVESVAWYEEDMSQGVRGEVTNTSDDTLSYVEIQALLYDSEGTRLGEALDNVSDLGGGETYAFDAVSLLTGDKADSVASYELNVSEGL